MGHFSVVHSSIHPQRACVRAHMHIHTFLLPIPLTMPLHHHLGCCLTAALLEASVMHQCCLVTEPVTGE